MRYISHLLVSQTCATQLDDVGPAGDLVLYVYVYIPRVIRLSAGLSVT